MRDAALGKARASRDADLADLCEELRMPSVSTDPVHRADCRRNAEWLIARLDALGFTTSLTDVIDGGHPVLRADLTVDPGAPHVTIYGHYDVQPADPVELWTSDPFEPRIDGGFVFARGCADNKGNHMAALKAVEHWTAAGGVPVNVRFLIEGEEEIGGESLPRYVREHAGELRTDVVVLWDGGFTADDRPALVAGMRGMLCVELEATGPAHDLHSGAFGGIAPNPCAELARVLAALHDDHGRVAVPGFYDDVRPVGDEERARWHVPPDDTERMLAIVGTDVLTGESGYDPVERRWTRPTLEINGFHGGFTGEGAKTIVPARASAKVSMRLVPDQDPAAIEAALSRRIASLERPGVRFAMRTHTSSPPVLCGTDHPGAAAMARAWEQATGVRTVFVRTGGSIPVATAFQEALGAPLVVSGVSHPNAGAHGPDEHLGVHAYHAGIDAMISFLGHLGDAGR